MTNNELTIEQLQAINGGGVFAKLDGFGSTTARSNQRRVVIHPDLIVDPGHKVGFDVGPVGAIRNPKTVEIVGVLIGL
ncbi:CCRG-2 family RiPP [Prochlorococcus marinus]|nr:CCRG-2 family RiPP [Prochlorococcus marinus]